MCFEGGADEEWVESGNIRLVGSEEVASVQAPADADYWLAAGIKNADFTSAQAELLEELLEYRYQIPYFVFFGRRPGHRLD